MLEDKRKEERGKGRKGGFGGWVGREAFWGGEVKE